MMLLPTGILSNDLYILKIDFQSTINGHRSNGVKLGREKYYFKTIPVSCLAILLDLSLKRLCNKLS